MEDFEASFVHYYHMETKKEETRQLKTLIDNDVKRLQKNYKSMQSHVGTNYNVSAYTHYFNFGLNTTTWRLFSNKPII